MAEYIEREEVMKTARDGYHSDFGRSIADLTSLKEVLEDTPVADVVEVVHSKWIKRNNERRCPICHFFYMTNGTTVYNFCPMCGAKMDGKRKDGDGNENEF